MLFKTATSRNIFSIVAVGMVATVATASGLFALSYQHMKTSSLAEMTSAAQISATRIEERILNGMQVVYTLRDTMQAINAAGAADRAVADGILAEIQRNTPGILGVWTGWEPDAFDGRDADYAGTQNHDATGRYIPYATSLEDGGINFEPLVDYEAPGDGDYYHLALSSQKPVVMEPFAYDVNGVSTLMTSLTAPIVVDGTVVGVAGADVGLDAITRALSGIRPLGTGFVALLSRDGSFVSHPDASFLGRPLKDTAEDASAWRRMMDNPGEVVEVVGADGVDRLAVAVPVRLLDDTSWFTVVSVPQETVYAYLTRMAWTSIAIIVGAALLLILLGVMISSRFRRRLEGIIGATGRIAGGQMDVEITEADAADEIGDMARSLVVLRDAAVAKDKLEREADANRALSEEERAARERQKAEEAAQIKFAVDALAEGLQQLAEGNVAYRIATPFAQGLDTLRRFGAEQREAARVARYADDFRRRTMKVLRVAFLSSAVLEFFSAVAIATLAVYIGLGLLGFVTLGPAESLTLFSGLFILLLAPEFYNPLRALAQHWHDRAGALAAAAGIREVLAAPPARPEPDAPAVRMPVRACSVALRSVALALPGRAALFADLALEVPAGQRLVITGESGAGKSTLLGLVGGFLAPDCGEIRVDGLPVAGFSRAQLSQLRGYLGQQPFLYAASIRDNILLGEPEDDGALARAVALAGLDELLAALPAGLDTPLGQDGLGVSGGQARRIALARVLLRPRPLLLLDEPTASLDADTEARFWADFDRALAECPATVICASHSLQAAAWADRVLALAEGRLVEVAR